MQARVGSKRLPGKVLMPFGQMTVLEHQMLRVQRAKVDEYWIATTQNPEDDAIEMIADSLGWRVFRGHETDVLSRFICVLDKTKPDYFFRLTGDNPLTGWEILDQMLSEVGRLSGTKYSLRDSVHSRLPLGIVPELLDAKKFLLNLPSLENRLEIHKEHVSAHVLEKKSWLQPRFLEKYPALNEKIRLTIDYKQDLDALRNLLGFLGGTHDFSLADLVTAVNRADIHPLGNESMRQRSFLESHD